MHKLAHALSGLVLVSALMAAEKPSTADAAAVIEKSRQKSLAYARSLPDFVCTEIVSRYQLGSVPGRRVAAGIGATIVDPIPGWSPLDKLTVSLSYFQGHEAHELKLLNGEPTDRGVHSGDLGVTSTGEFGGILRNIFDPVSQTSFHWKSWKDADSRTVAVYVYEVERAHSTYFVETGQRDKMRRVVVGFHGTLEIDRDTGEVVHLDHVADHVPSEPDIKAVTAVDYDVIEVAGNRYLLPVKSETRLDRRSGAWKNEAEFRDYRKFEVGSKMDFGGDK
jgi:hypothetical protein